jgi:excisionase family DNA binding protein
MLHTDRPTAEKIEPMLTITEVARLLNVHINTLRRWSDRGLVRAYRIGPRADRRFREDDITGFLTQLKGKSTGGQGYGNR